jgi:hypothetical protein
MDDDDDALRGAQRDLEEARAVYHYTLTEAFADPVKAGRLHRKLIDKHGLKKGHAIMRRALLGWRLGAKRLAGKRGWFSKGYEREIAEDALDRLDGLFNRMVTAERALQRQRFFSQLRQKDAEQRVRSRDDERAQSRKRRKLGQSRSL